MEPGGTYAPLRNATFRRLWAAGIVSNLGVWMQRIAAGWLMVELTRSPALVALLATAAAIPTFVLTLPAGALADVLDRRRLIIATQAWQALVAAGLGALALADAMTPGLLLAGVGLYGLGATLGMPPAAGDHPRARCARGDATGRVFELAVVHRRPGGGPRTWWPAGRCRRTWLGVSRQSGFVRRRRRPRLGVATAAPRVTTAGRARPRRGSEPAPPMCGC